MPTISTAEELDVALESRRFVLFVDVDWSPTVVMGRRVLYPLVRSWRPLPGANRVSFFRLDVTDPDEAMWAKLRTIPGIHWLSGAGELLLHRDGETIIVDCAAAEGSMRLRERLIQFSEE